jgi:tetratricopeptide (TPR) repeat protein
LRDRVAETERLYITSLYHELVTGDIGRSIEALKLHTRITPRNPGPHNNLAVAYVTIGQFEQALEEGQIALRLDPTSSIRYGMLGNALVRLSRFADARQLYQRAQEQQLDSLSIRRGLFRIAFVEQNHAEMERQLSWAATHSNEHAGLDWQARAAAYSGQWRRSLEHTRRAIDAATLNEEPEVAAEYAAESALRGTALDQCAATKALASQAISIKRNPVSLTRAGLALALCGDTRAAQSMIDELRKRYPQHTIVNWIWLPMIQAAIELKQAHDESAVELLKLVQRYEDAAEFWPQYLRGQAYLRLGMESEAAAEFTKILEHRGHDVQSVLYPLAHLRLARAILKRDMANARNSYGQFLALWKNADPELPMLTEATKGVGPK